MALRLVSKRFMPFSKKQAHHGINNAFWMRKVIDKDAKVLPYYRSVVSQLDGLGDRTNDLKGFTAALEDDDHTAALQIWTKICETPYSSSASPTLQELTKKYQCYGPPQLEPVITYLAQLPVASLKELWIAAKTAPLCAYLFPKIIHRQLRSGRVEIARDTIIALSKLCEIKRDLQALNFAVNVYLNHGETSFSKLTDLLDKIDSRHSPRIGEKTAMGLAQLPRAELVPCFEYLQARRIPMNKKGFSTFLRAVFASSDEASVKIIEGAKSIDYPLGFYSFLTRHLCHSKDAETLDWLFENTLMKMAHQMPEKLPFILHLLVLRTIALDGVRSLTPILDKMGEISESTWMIIYQEFRRLGRVDKCNETLHRALSRGHRLSLPFVGEYLETVASFYNMDVYLKCLQKLIPEIAPVLDELGITELAKSQLALSSQEMPLLTLGKEMRGFPVHRIHESWLNITYKVVLNNVDDVTTIQELFNAYHRYVLSSRASVSLAAVDEFVLKLTSMKTSAATDAAEEILVSALNDFRLKRAQRPTNNSKSLGALVYSLTCSRRHVDLQRAVLLVNKVLASPAASVRGSALKPLLAALENHQELDSVKKWAENLGAKFQ